ncbi:unnamed protein product [Adineta ricciae]|uniref:Uncharacterized protein n=1 Tax=Adineta ricciae TaxID=249248 RepID=A0A814WHM1_ADIRI|nr:unnamed protein product [Adineta ricciae]
MASKPHGIYNNQNAVNYINKKGIDELFEAIMTALMVHKPDDHIAFIRECLDKVQNNPHRVRWDLFVTNNKGALPSRPPTLRNRQKILPPMRSTNSTPRTSQSLDRKAPVKAPTLPPIDHNKRLSQNLPLLLLLSKFSALKNENKTLIFRPGSSNSTKLCARLLERYNQVSFLSIEDIANIDYDSPLDLSKQEHRYQCIQNAIEQYRSTSHGFIIAGHLDEKHFYRKWLEKLGRIDAMIILSSDRLNVANRNLNITQINPNNDFDVILAEAARVTDEIFPLNISKTKSSELTQPTSNGQRVPIIFCIDNYQLPVKEAKHPRISARLSLDAEFENIEDENEEEINNSFVHALAEQIAEDFSYKSIHYTDFKQSFLRFDQLKTTMIDSMSTCTGYVIDGFPTSSDELRKFQTEIGPCSALIYIGEEQPETNNEEFNAIIDKFKAENKAIYVDGRVEVDEIYEDLKKDILKRI